MTSLGPLLADLLVVLHLAFVVFVVAGGVLVWRWPRLAWLHLPCAAWGALVSFAGWVCPLTPLEQRLRLAGGVEAYQGDFVAHYVMPVLYPEGLTRGAQVAAGVFVVVANVVLYTLARRRSRARFTSGSRPGGLA